MSDLIPALYYRLPFKNLKKESSFREELKELGVEIYLTAEDLEEENTLATIKKNFTSVQLNIHAPFYDLNIASQDSFIRQHSRQKIQKAFSWACRLNASRMIVHLNFNDVYYRDTQQAWLEGCAFFYRKLLKKSKLTRIAIENTAENSPEIFIRLQEMVDHPFFIFCLDIGHLNVFAPKVIDQWLTALSAQQELHLHIHDNLGEKDQHLAAGLGNFNWLSFLTKLRKNRQKVSCTFENLSVQDILISKNNFLNFWRLSGG